MPVSRSSLRRRSRRPALIGRNPSNMNGEAGMPATESAAVTADGPGTGTTGMPGARQTEQVRALPGLVVLEIARGGRRDPEAREQGPRPARVLAGDQIGVPQ